MAENKPSIPTLQELSASNVESDVQNVAAALRELADKVEREYQQWSRLSYAKVAAAVQHDVLWGVANVGLDKLTRTAAEADAARLAGKE